MEEDLFTTVFSELKHPIRRDIVKFIGNKEKSYTEILEHVDVERGKLNFHLRNLMNLVHRNTSGNYELSDLGLSGLDLIEKIESIRGFKAEKRWMNTSIAIIYLALFTGLLALMSPFINYFVLLTGISALASAMLLAVLWGKKRIPFYDQYEVRFILSAVFVSALFFGVFYTTILPQLELRLYYTYTENPVSIVEPITFTIPAQWHYAKTDSGYQLRSPNRDVLMSIYVTDFADGSFEKVKKLVIDLQKMYGRQFQEANFKKATICNADAVYLEYSKQLSAKPVKERLYALHNRGQMVILEVDIPLTSTFESYTKEIESITSSIQC